MPSYLLDYFEAIMGRVYELNRQRYVELKTRVNHLELENENLREKMER